MKRSPTESGSLAAAIHPYRCHVQGSPEITAMRNVAIVLNDPVMRIFEIKRRKSTIADHVTRLSCQTRRFDAREGDAC